MKLTVNISGNTGPVAYPYRKVVFIGEYAEVAELPCEGESSENIVYHADLIERLVDTHPELDGLPFKGGWIMENEPGEAVLHLAGGGEVSQEEADELARLLGAWCEKAGISTLTITDTTKATGTEKAGDASDWTLDLS